MKNIKTGLQKLHGMVDTKDLTPWQNNFIKSIWNQTKQGTVTASLSPNQIETMESIHDKHFAD
jgi:hypothetical protein